MKIARRHLKLTTKAAGAIVSLTRPTWEKYELGKTDPKCSALFALVNLGISPRWLINGEGAMLFSDAKKDTTSICVANDPELVGLLTEGILRIYGELDRAISPREAAKTAVTLHNSIVSETSDKVGRAFQVGQHLEILRQNLLSEVQNHTLIQSEPSQGTNIDPC